MSPPGEKRNALGKGLSALIPPKPQAPAAGATPAPAAPQGSHHDHDGPRRGVLTVPIEDVHPNRHQPRKTFDDATLDELAASIKEHGLMQPVLVRKRGNALEIIAGERRWRACQRAGLKTVEVIVKDLADSEVFEWALIENIQREDLNPIEEAEAYRRLLDSSNMTQEQLAERLSKDRSTIANALRLLRLPDDVRRQVIAGALSMGHARALLALDDGEQMIKMARDTVKKGLSVREVEKAVRLLKKSPNGEPAADGTPAPGAPDPFAELPGGAHAVRRVTDELTRRLSTRVRIVPSGRKGKIEIDWSSPGELERLIQHLKG
ncbi:ParB/RepB/Spo0J family partition protein [Myxococcota bacterium]|nr:ParB/RepB/Spo0J family partition protein [Myxococcota bacterium]